MKNQMGKLEKLCIKWLNENFNHMEPFIMKEYPDYIFHMKDGRCILQYNKKNGYVYVSYREIWKFFESFFSMDNFQIKDITKIWVEKHYKVGVTTIQDCSFRDQYEVEEHYKVDVTKTVKSLACTDDRVEEHYKVGVTTTSSRLLSMSIKVEEDYKMGVTTTFRLPLIGTGMVEEDYKMGVKSTQEFGWRIQEQVDEQYNLQSNE